MLRSRNWFKMLSVMALAGHAPLAIAASANYSSTADGKSFSYDDFEKILQQNPPPKNPDEVLSQLPADCRSHFNLMYASKSLQSSDWNDPRIILSCDNGKLLLGFGGNSSIAGGDRIEVIHFGGANNTNAFSTAEVTFNGGKPTNQSQPTSCVQCHSQPTRPIWDTYDLWTGAYGSSGGSMQIGSTEQTHFQTFLTTHAGKSDRYSQLLGLYEGREGNNNYDGSVSTKEMSVDPDTRMGLQIGKLNLQRISQETKNLPLYNQLRYALLGTLLRCGSISDFIPPKQLNEMKANYPGISVQDQANQMAVTASRYFVDRLKLQGNVDTAPGYTQQPIPTQNLAAYSPQSEREGRGRVTFDPAGVKSLADFRVLMKLQGIDINDWYLTLEKGSYDSADGINGMEFELAYQLTNELAKQDPAISAKIPTDSVTDPYPYDEIDIAKLYNVKPVQSFSKQEKESKQTLTELYKAFQNGPACQFLKQRSLAAMKNSEITADLSCKDTGSSTLPLTAQQQSNIRNLGHAVTAASSTSANSAYGMFQTYCASCHQGSNAVIDFHVGSLTDMKNYRGVNGRTFVDMLKDPPKMPQGTETWSDAKKAQWQKDRVFLLQQLQSKTPSP